MINYTSKIRTNVQLLPIDLPSTNTGMAFKAKVRNGAQTAADNLEIAKVYIETDY